MPTKTPKALFSIGDLINDKTMSTSPKHSWGVGIIEEADFETEELRIYSYNEEDEKIEQTFPINQWRYLVKFSHKHKEGVWIYETALDKLISAGMFEVVKANDKS